MSLADRSIFARVVLERLPGSAPALSEAMRRLAATIAAWHETAPLVYAGDPPRLVRLDGDDLTRFVGDAEAARERGEPAVIVLRDDPVRPRAILAVDREPRSHGVVEYAWFGLPGAGPPPPLAETARVVRSAAHDFGAFHAHLEDEALLQEFRGQRATQRSRESLPTELRDLVPDHEPGILRDLLVPQEFDSRRVPEAVWWINYWDRVQVETIGADRVRSAPWAAVDETGDSALVLAATADPVDLSRPEHVARLNELLDHLDLRRLQEANRNAV